MVLLFPIISNFEAHFGMILILFTFIRTIDVR